MFASESHSSTPGFSPAQKGGAGGGEHGRRAGCGGAEGDAPAKPTTCSSSNRAGAISAAAGAAARPWSSSAGPITRRRSPGAAPAASVASGRRLIGDEILGASLGAAVIAVRAAVAADVVCGRAYHA